MTPPRSSESGDRVLAAKRVWLGAIAVACLAVGLGLYATRTGDPTTGPAASLTKIGVLLGVLWLATPNLDRLLTRVPAWLWGVTLVALAFVAIRPMTLLAIGPALIVLWALAYRWLGR